jgi:hypothetical protein
MFSSVNFAPSSNLPQTSNSVLNKLALLFPNLLASLLISIVGSILLTLLSYGLSAAFGFPIFPFLFIMI